jgi:hypothetical protein
MSLIPPTKDLRKVIEYKSKRLAGEGGLGAPYNLHVEVNVNRNLNPAPCEVSRRRVMIRMQTSATQVLPKDTDTMALQLAIDRVNALDDALFDDFCNSLELFLQDSQRTSSAKFQKSKRTMMLAFRNMVLHPLFDLGTSAAINEEQTGAISTFTFNNQIFSMIVDNLGLGVNLHGYCGETLKCCRRSPHPTWIVACVYIPQ